MTCIFHVCDQCPEFNGYNMKLSREQGHALKTKTKIVYVPLIDRPPANSAAMMTALLRAHEIPSIWENQARFSNIYLRLGGMHLWMSYSGCIGTLMADTGIVEILGVAFGGVLKMLTGKKFPQNVRALRMLVEELLGPVFEKNHLESILDLKKTLDEISSESRTAKLWVDCLIKPVFTMLKYIRAEREADWVLHLQTVREMMPLFFAATHTHYAHYALYYLCSMEGMPCEVRKYFMETYSAPQD